MMGTKFTFYENKYYHNSKNFMELKQKNRVYLTLKEIIKRR